MSLWRVSTCPRPRPGRSSPQGPSPPGSGQRTPLPLRLRGRTIGALNMFSAEPGALDERDMAAAQALADIATIALIQHQLAVNAQGLTSQLSEALNSRIVIEQAKGRVSQASGLDMDRAFKRLRTHARNHNLHLSELAAEVAEGSVRPDSLDPSTSLSPPGPVSSRAVHRQS